MSASILLCRGLPAAAAAAVLLALVGCSSAPVQPDPTQVKLNDLDQRVTRIERVVSNQSLVQLSSRIDQLDMELRELRGEVEELQNNDDTLSKQQRDFYTDLDRRVAAVEAAQK
ncbi:MAG: YbgF trimerization domain-containing protein, partial [Steroidobacteraceae bacterium]